MDINSYISGERLVLLKVIYKMPDYKWLLQEFIWQLNDMPPKFPKMKQFLTFWNTNLDGKIYKVYYSVDTGLSNWQNSIYEYRL